MQDTATSTLDRPTSRGARSRRRRALLAALVVAGVFAPGLSPVATAAETDAWSSATGGPGNTRANLGESVVSTATADGMEASWEVWKDTPTPAAPAVVGRVVYRVHNGSSSDDPPRLIAHSAGTGEELWSVPFPDDYFVHDGVAVSGGKGILSVDGVGFYDRAGLLAVDLRTRSIAWFAPLPPLPDELSWLDPGISAEVVVDDLRAYVVGGSTNLAAYRLSDGVRLWSQPITANPALGPRMAPMIGNSIAVADGVVYTGDTRLDTVRAWSAATGAPLWRAPGGGTPVIAGGRVFSTLEVYSLTEQRRLTRVVALDADGCGRTVCPVLWTWTVPADQETVEIGAADARFLFVTYPPNDGTQELVRLSASTGAELWSAVVGEWVQGAPARGADAVWVIVDDVELGRRHWLSAYAATGTSTEPLLSIDLGARMTGDADLAIGAGAVLVENGWDVLRAFRVPGSWEQRSRFVDVPHGAPFADDIEWLAAEGITSGGWDGSFRPESPVTRQEMAVFLHKFVNRGETPDPCSSSRFRDVPASSSYCGAIAWLADHGITRGTSDGRFLPLGTVTRQSMAAFFYHLANGGAAPPRCTQNAFRDVPESSPYCGSIAWLSDQGITMSSTSGAFGPTTPVSREMMAAFLHRLDGVLAAG